MMEEGRLVGKRMTPNKRSEGFVLVTVLVLLALLTVLGVGMFMSSIATQQDSAAASRAAQARYYAETAIEYMRWAWANDADFDSAITHVGDLPWLGDREEWARNTKNPGPTTIGGTGGQVMYFDNSPLAGRAIKWPLPVVGGVTQYPVLHHISVNLPRYVKLDIASDGGVSTSMPGMPHQNPPVAGTDIPRNGAVLWLTAGDEKNDFELDPTSTACGGAWIGAGKGCIVATGAVATYHVIVYALGYVDGRPLSLVRALIQ